MNDTAIFYSQEKESHYGRFIARPDLTGILIPGVRGKLLAKLYLTAGIGKHPVILLLHGYQVPNRTLIWHNISDGRAFMY